MGGDSEFFKCWIQLLEDEPNCVVIDPSVNCLIDIVTVCLWKQHQQDLLSEDVFLLDAYSNVYVWLGSEARPKEKTMAIDAALVAVFYSFV